MIYCTAYTTHFLFLGVYPGFTQIEWFEKVYPLLAESEKPQECVQKAGEILYLVCIYSQTCLMWPSKGTVKYGHIRQVVA
jgi:hypothetical protein